MDNTSVLEVLGKYDKAQEDLAKKNLSWFRFMVWKYASGRSFIAWQLSSLVTWLQAIGGAVAVVGPKATWAFMIKMFPWLAPLVTKIISATKTAFAGILGVLSLGH